MTKPRTYAMLTVTSLTVAITLSACSSSTVRSTAPARGAPTSIPGRQENTSSATITTTTPATTSAAPTVSSPDNTTNTTNTTSTAASATSNGSGSTPYAMPVADGARAGYSRDHHDYPASDVFVSGNCGSSLISPVSGVILEARRDDGWDKTIDNPATRGGKSVAILGDDGVRYYMAHFDSLTTDIEAGVRVEVGHPLGLMGMTGRAGACHVHFAISPPCPGKEWSVRRGVIWPWKYLDAWRRGQQLSPLPEVEQWVAAHPDACELAMADPSAADS